MLPATIYTILNKRIKSTDFPLQCRGMYYFAKGRHAHQARKGSGYPYFIHPRAVAFLVMKYGGSITQINAALGHDLLEDTETSYSEIAAVANSFECADLCTELRNNTYTIKEIGKTDYMSHKLLEISDKALLIKLADMYCNMSDMPTDAARIRMMKNIEDLLANRKLAKSATLLAHDILKVGEAKAPKEE